jgi:TPR repeat protein
MKQGQQLVEAGDLAAARTLFQRAAEANDAAAAMALGATYDPTVLAGMRAVGIEPDVVKARFWYQNAASLGSSEAKRRLDVLVNR